MEVKRGHIVRSLAGHDRQSFMTVLETDGNFAIVCDGKRRKLLKPKKKKLIHLAPTKTVLEEEKLATDRQIRKSLRMFAAENDDKEL